MKISKKLFGLFMILFAVTLLVACEGEEDQAPVFTGTGNAVVTVGDAFDPLDGVAAMDAEDGDLTSAIVVSGDTVDTSAVATFTVTYTVEDSAGNVTTADRTVQVNAPSEEDYPLAQYPEGVNLSFLDAEQKDKLFAAAESYLLENVYGGVPLYTRASRVMFSSRVQLFSEAYNGVMGYGTAFSQLTADDSTVELFPDVTGNAGEYTWRSSFNSNPTTLNPWLADDSASSDFIGDFTGGLYEFRFDSTKTGYEILPSLASALPVPTDATEINGKEYAKIWSIPVRDDLEWAFHPDIDTSGFAAGFEKLDASDWLWTWKLALDNQWFRAISGGGDFITKGIKGAAEYVEGSVSWDDVGLKLSEDGSSIVLEFVNEQSEFDILYGFSGGSLEALNQELYESLGADDAAREAAYGQDELSVAASGLYLLETYTPDQLLVYGKNALHPEAESFYYTGLQYRYIDGSDAIFAEFLAGRLESAGIPASEVENYLNDPRVRVAPDATTWRLMINSFGTTEARDAYIAANPGVGLSEDFEPEPILSYLEMRQAMYYGFDRYDAAVNTVKLYLPAHTYFAPTYFLDGSSGVSVRGGAAGAALLAEFGGESYGFFPTAATTLFGEAVTAAIADGFYTAGTADAYTTIELTLTYASSGNTSAQAMVAYIEQQYEELLVDNTNFVNVDIIINDVDFPGNYYDYMMIANTDLGIGGISGSLLDAPGFLDVFSDDNRGGFTLNWGIDTTTANIPVSYTNLDGEVVYETWGFNALITAMVEKVYVRDGVEQTSWTDPLDLITAYLDMGGSELDATADGTALAETFEGATLAELATEVGADAVVAYTATTVEGRSFLFLVTETFGEYELLSQTSLITDAGAAWADWATRQYGSSYGFTADASLLLTDENIGDNAYIQDYFDTVDDNGTPDDDTDDILNDVVITSVQQFLDLYFDGDPIPDNLELYALDYTYSAGSFSDAILVQNINGYILFYEWL